jgi:D-alanyl-D-alanine carboxypeptidase
MHALFVLALAFLQFPGQAQGPAVAQPISNAQFMRLESRMQQKLDALKQNVSFPGATVGFILADGRSSAVSTGYADVENKIPLKPADRMLAGSIGKTYVAAVLLQLIEDGKIGLDDKLMAWLGSEVWVKRLPNAADLTIRCLMTHSSGIPEYFEMKGSIAALRSNPERIWAPAELVAFVLDAKPLFAVGEGWSYADTNYMLLGLVAEKATGKPLFEEISQRLLKPLHLDRTIPSNRRSLPEMAVGYSMRGSPFRVEGRTIVDGKFLINPQFEYAGGGLASTPEDLARWAKALYEGKVFRKRETLQAMLTGVEASSGRGGGMGKQYGLGVQIADSEWGPSYGHGGWFPGYLSEMAYFPKYQVAVALQFNTDAGQSLRKSLRAHLDEFMKVLRAGDEK